MSTTGRENSWWIWVQTRPPYTTHITEATTPSSSASVRPISSCPLILLDLKPWSKRGEMNDTEGLWCVFCDIWVSEGDFNTVFTYDHSLRRHVKAINKLADAGMFFWDYGNAFLLEAQRAGQWFNTYTQNVFFIFSQSMSDQYKGLCFLFYRSSGRKGRWRSN